VRVWEGKGEGVGGQGQGCRRAVQGWTVRVWEGY
jgi:hypothetical protein